MAELEETCGTCKLISRRDQGMAPAWDSILRTDAWDVVHAYDTSLLAVSKLSKYARLLCKR